MVIVADQSGKEIRSVKFNAYDFEVGDEANDFEIKILKEEWEDIPQDALIYIPNTEYGGIVKRIEVDTKQGYISLGGLTWRGMLKSKIIQPPEGEDYAADEGDVNTIISHRINSNRYFGTDTGIRRRLRNGLLNLIDSPDSLLLDILINLIRHIESRCIFFRSNS